VTVLIGAAPRTEWLPASVARDAWGYVLTGPADTDPTRRPFETTSPGIFAVGDARHDSIKRVAAAVGEAAACIRLVHDSLQQ
jgi:thioredoxin reductase (NADPH)